MAMSHRTKLLWASFAIGAVWAACVSLSVAQERREVAADDSPTVAAEADQADNSAPQRVAEIPADDFARLQAAVKPQKGESPWRDVPWLTNITEARRRALAEDKPLVIFTAADGSPLART